LGGGQGLRELLHQFLLGLDLLLLRLQLLRLLRILRLLRVLLHGLVRVLLHGMLLGLLCLQLCEKLLEAASCATCTRSTCRGW